MKVQNAAFLFFVNLATVSFAATTWTGQGGDNAWGNADNWSNGAPSYDQDATIPEGDWVISIDGEHTSHAINIKEGAGTVTFIGSGILSHVSNQGESVKLTVHAGRHIVVDGPVLNPYVSIFYGNAKATLRNGEFRSYGSKELRLYGGSAVEVEGGTFSTALMMTNSSSLSVRGGRLNIKSCEVNSGCVIEVFAGTVDFCGTSYPTVRSGGSFRWHGGTIYGIDVDKSPGELSVPARGYLLPAGKGSSLILPASRLALSFNDEGEYMLKGSITATNTATRTPSVQLSESAVIKGGGDIVTGNLLFSAADGIALCNIRSLALCEKLQLGFKSSLVFTNGVTFRAWGNWKVAPPVGKETYQFQLMPYGPVVFDTLNVFDGETEHSISMTQFVGTAVSELKVKGGGSVTLMPKSGAPEKLARLSVMDSSGLSFPTPFAAELLTGSLRLDPGSLLSLPVKGGSFVDAAVASVDADAKIEVNSVPDTLEAGRMYPVYNAPVGTVNPSSSVRIADGVTLPEGWGLNDAGCCSVLWDGTVTDADESLGKYTFTGKNGGTWSNQANWPSGTTPPDSSSNFNSAEVHFSGNRQLYVTNDVGSMRVARFIVEENAGPYTFRGYGHRYYRPTSEDETNGCSLMSKSQFPFIDETKVTKFKDQGAFVVRALRQGCIALVGGGTVPETKTYYCGDVRLGGKWTLKEIVHSSVTGDRANRLTILPEAEVDVTGQTSDIEGDGYCFVAEGATLTVAGEKLSWPTDENTHYVDGAWNVQCPVIATAKQVFTGEGTLRMTRTDASEGAIGLSGSLTLVHGDWTGALSLEVRDSPTLKLESDARFAPPGLELALDTHATLTVDTAAHSFSLGSPVTGDGCLVKKGAGDFVLDCLSNVVDSVRIEGGRLVVGRGCAEACVGEMQPLITYRSIIGGEIAVQQDRYFAEARGNGDGTFTCWLKTRKGLVLSIR